MDAAQQRTLRADNWTLQESCRRSQQECWEITARAVLAQKRGAAAVDRAVERKAARLGGGSAQDIRGRGPCGPPGTCGR